MGATSTLGFGPMRHAFALSVLLAFVSGCTSEIDPGIYNGEPANQAMAYTTAEAGRRALEAYLQNQEDGRSEQEASAESAEAAGSFGGLRPLDRGTKVDVLGRMEGTEDSVPEPLVWVEVTEGYYRGERLVIDEAFVE